MYCSAYWLKAPNQGAVIPFHDKKFVRPPKNYSDCPFDELLGRLIKIEFEVYICDYFHFLSVSPSTPFLTEINIFAERTREHSE